MIFNPSQGKVFISQTEFVDKNKGFSIENIDFKNCAEFACKLHSDDVIYVAKDGQLMIGPYELHITS